MKYTVALIAFISLFISAVSSVANPTMTLEQCIEIAFKNNHDILKSKNNIESAQKDVARSRGYLLPNLDVSASYSYGETDRTTKNEQIIEGQQIIVEQDIKDNNQSINSSISLTQPIFNGGRNWASYSSAKVNEEITSLTHDINKQIIAFSVKQYYFNLLKAKDLLDIANETLKQSEKYLEKTQTMYELGLVSNSDVLKSKVNLAQDKYNKISAENSVSIAKSQLAHAMGENIIKGIDISPLKESKIDTFDLTKNIDIALQNRVEIRQSKLSITLAKLGVRTAFSERLPALNGFANLSWDKNESMNSENETTSQNWNVGLRLSMNIFDGLSTESNIQKSKIDVRSKEIQLEEMKQDIILEVQKAYLNIIEATQKIEASKEEVKSAEEDLNFAEEQYELGQLDFIELSDAQLGLTKAKSHHIQAVYEYHLAEADLKKAIGTY